MFLLKIKNDNSIWQTLGDALTNVSRVAAAAAATAAIPLCVWRRQTVPTSWRHWQGGAGWALMRAGSDM